MAHHISIIEMFGLRKVVKDTVRLHRPNRKTRKTFHDAEKGKNVRSFATVEELMKDLHS